MHLTVIFVIFVLPVTAKQSTIAAFVTWSFLWQRKTGDW